MQGGTFTISNGGVYGSLMSTPILNAPQSGILGMHKIQERPMVVGGQIVIRPMMYLALTYDHRIVDGQRGGDLPGARQGRHRGPAAAGAGSVALASVDGLSCARARSQPSPDRHLRTAEADRVRLTEGALMAYDLIVIGAGPGGYVAPSAPPSSA